MKRLTSQNSISLAGPIKLPVFLKNRIAHFKLYFFRLPKGDCYALEKGAVAGTEYPLVRIHSACNIAHIFHSERCDCQRQLELAMEKIESAGCGLLIYALNHEGRGVGAFDHIRVYQKQDEGFDTVDSYLELGLPVDARDYSEIKHIFAWFNLKKIRLLTNNPKKVEAAESIGCEVVREPLIAKLHRHNQSQIKTKVEKLGHLIPFSHD